MKRYIESDYPRPFNADESAVAMIKESIANGEAYKKFMEFVMRQGGTTNNFSAKNCLLL